MRNVFFDRTGFLRLPWFLFAAFSACFLVVAAFWVVGTFFVDKPNCERRASGLSTEARYLMPAGTCQFRLPDGRWIDSDSYRVVVRGGT